jgi:hypothetical protein
MRTLWTNREARTWIVLSLTFAMLLALFINAVSMTSGNVAT